MFVKIVFVFVLLFSTMQNVCAESLRSQIDSRYNYCMTHDWVKYYSLKVPGKYAECVGQGYELLFRHW
jgi:hypothetical protein